jgi:hypothetical protein
VNICFSCPVCDRPDRVDLARGCDRECAGCDHRLRLEADPALARCTVCGNAELYKKKDFPHWLGMSILVGACVLSVITYWFYEPMWTWVILIGSATFDGLLYLWVGDVVVCYRCNAHYRGFKVTEAHEPFEITIGERYRQERLRRAQLKAATGAVNNAPDRAE